MSAIPLLTPLEAHVQPAELGRKAANLARLAKLGLPIPRTYVIPAAAYQRWVEGDPGLLPALAAALAHVLDPAGCYAVRSSANLEDSFEHSFAGQFQTVLDTQGSDALLQAVQTVWDSAQSESARAYLQRRRLSADRLRMAVIVQEMVRPVVSGVAFSRNPLTGAHETVIEAVNGPGTLLVQDGVTPFRWIYRAGAFTQLPQDSPLPEAAVTTIAQATRQVARRVKAEVDLEWVYDGQQVVWVQMRAITTLDKPPLYSNRIARDVLPGLIKPLIWSINVPLVNGAWIRLLTELIGPNTLTPDTLAKSFYYRAYFNMGLLGDVFAQLGFPAELLEQFAGIAPKTSGGFRFRPGPRALALLPRLARFLFGQWRLPARLEPALPTLEAAFRAMDQDGIDRQTPQELVQGIDHLFRQVQEAAYYNIVVPLAMQAYNGMLRAQVKKLGHDPAQLDLRAGPEFQALSPAYHLDALHRQFQALPSDLQDRFRAGAWADILTDPRFAALRPGLETLLDRFGHLSDSGNDFSCPPWRENRALLLQMVASHNPNGKTSAEPLRFEQIRLPFGRAGVLRGLHRRARRYLLYREQISSIYTYGYGLFRRYFLALGTQFTRQGWLDSPEDIFYLEWRRIRQAVERGAPDRELRAAPARVRQEMEQAEGLQLPTVIFGDQPPPPEIPDARKLAGVPAARGYCTGPARVVRGMQDFGKVQPGDVLVVPHTDVGWTPLFAAAAGVISESGGLLSHSAIIAREYGIPAVVSVPSATHVLRGATVSINGYTGEITVHQ